MTAHSRISRREVRRHPFCDCNRCCERGYFSRIGGATFSAGAGGSAGWAPAFWASASGCAGCGGMSEGRWPVVAGSEGADGFVSAPGVDWVGCVACAICMGSRALSAVNASAEAASPAAISIAASSISRRYSRWRCSAGMAVNPTTLFVRSTAGTAQGSVRNRPAETAKIREFRRRHPRCRRPAACPWHSRPAPRPARCHCGAPEFPHRPPAARSGWCRRCNPPP